MGIMNDLAWTWNGANMLIRKHVPTEMLQWLVRHLNSVENGFYSTGCSRMRTYRQKYKYTINRRIGLNIFRLLKESMAQIGPDCSGWGVCL